jgi:proteasome accessory factor C
MSTAPATERLRRLLLILPWLMERGEVRVAEVAERFRVDEESLVRDLELVSMCGLPPYVDEMIDLFIDEGTIHMGVPRLFTRPLRIDQVEAFELLSAGRAAMQLPGADPDGALNRGLRKLARGLGEDDTGVLVVTPRPPEMVVITEAVAERRRVRIGYQSHVADEASERAITPFRVFTAQGKWYVVAHDDRSREIRTFRVDRIVSVVDDGPAEVAPPDDLPGPDMWFADGDVPRVVLDVGPAGRWVIESYPIDEVTGPDADGWWRVRMAVTSDRWLARLLVRLGPAVRVVEPTEAGRVGRDVARRILERYRA